MNIAVPALEAAISEARRLERVLKKGRPRVQVTLSDERSSAKATSLAWFNSHRAAVAAAASEKEVSKIDAQYKGILETSERAGARTRYLATLKVLIGDLVRLRSTCVSSSPATTATADQPPDFTPLISDPAMQQIVIARWTECTKCLKADASLAATVMMGGLLEGLLLARVNKESSQAKIFTAKSAPRDKFKKTRPLSEWGLTDYIEVAHELKWISVPAKDVGKVLRDYRNYVHPHKQLSHGVHLTAEDAAMFWEISKAITRQIISSVH